MQFATELGVNQPACRPGCLPVMSDQSGKAGTDEGTDKPEVLPEGSLSGTAEPSPKPNSNAQARHIGLTVIGNPTFSLHRIAIGTRDNVCVNRSAGNQLEIYAKFSGDCQPSRRERAMEDI